MTALRNYSTRQTPQGQKVPGKNQVMNNAGGAVFETSPLQRLRRSLVLGTDGGTYYQSERDLTRQNAEWIIDLLDADRALFNGDPMETLEGSAARWIVDEVVAVSTEGRAPSNDQALFVLALCASFGSDVGKRYAFSKLPQVARIGTHLFHFVQYMTQFRGWGQAARDGVSGYYSTKSPQSLAYDLTKYRQRDGWSHRDVLRLAHPTPQNGHKNMLFKYAVSGDVEVPLDDAIDTRVAGYLAAVDDIKRQDDIQGVVDLIREYGLPREVIPTEHLNSPLVWEAMLDGGMPMTAMVRNLAKMTSIGLIAPMSKGEARVVASLSDADAIRRSRIHPIQVLNALLIYREGRGALGSLTWQPSAAVIDALDAAFYTSFGNVEPSGKRTMLALDVSGSMSASTSMSQWLDCRTAAAAMALVTANVEPQHLFTGFTADGWGVGDGRYRWRNSAMQTLPISSRQRLDDVVRYMAHLKFGATDCSLPMLYALNQRLEIDTFVIYTDSETWAGTIHPFQALKRYRQQAGIDARLVVVAMTATPFTIADPSDPGMLDVVGFDTAVPNIITMFSKGDL